MPHDNFFRRCTVAFYCFYSASRFGKNIKDFEGGNIPPQRPLACSPQVQEEAEHRRFTPQTVYFSPSSTRRLVKVAPIRLLQKMSFGKRVTEEGLRTISSVAILVLRISYMVCRKREIADLLLATQ